MVANIDVTILDVAKLAKVSPATVSQALNGKRPVSKETREQIMKAIDTLGYVPSRGASKLKSDSSQIIGCYVADITEGFASLIVRGVERALSGTQYSMLFVSGMEFDNDFSKALKFLLSYKIDGLLLCYPLPVLHELTTCLKNYHGPVISMNNEIAGIKSIIPDNVNAGRLAAQHLVENGMKFPAMICGPEDRLSSLRRFEGFFQYLSENGFALPHEHVRFGSFSFENGYNSTTDILKVFPQVDGIFCANDYIAAGAIAKLLELGKKVPQDVKVLGFDNRDFSSFWQVPISTFQQPLEQIGITAVTTLKDFIEKNETITNDTQLLQSELIVRKSTKAP
ncbi:MAG: LacI family transcriptional regulator [Treponema sp.]|nr:LacI family transcriptional regulator [Treponema sp.]